MKWFNLVCLVQVLLTIHKIKSNGKGSFSVKSRWGGGVKENIHSRSFPPFWFLSIPVLNPYPCNVSLYIQNKYSPLLSFTRFLSSDRNCFLILFIFLFDHKSNFHFQNYINSYFYVINDLLFSGAMPHRPCIFPFKFNGVVYTECTWVSAHLTEHKVNIYVHCTI